MSLSRIKPNILQPIHPKSCPPTQFRCLRTKAGRLRPLLPRQGAFGLPGKIGEKVKERVELAKEKVTMLTSRKAKQDIGKISLVPKEPGQELPVTPSQSMKPLSEMTKEEIKERTRLEEQEKRIADFEKERKGKTREDIEKGMYERQTGRKIEEPKEEDKPDNEVYERDIIGRKYKKKKAEYKIDLYEYPEWS